MSIGGLIDPPPVRGDAIQRPNLRVALLWIAVLATLFVACFVVAWIALVH
jgi:CHASE2 domain-containing sensor protein